MSKNLLFVTCLILALFNINGCDESERNTLNDGLIAFFPFDGDARDHSPFQNHGTVYGAALTTNRFGRPNSAYYFNGINSDIEVPHDSILYPQYEISICTWVKFDDLTKVGSVIEKGRDISIGFYAIRFVPDQNLTAGFRFEEDVYPNAATGFAPTDVVPDTSRWMFVAMTYDGERMKYYINGQLHDTLTVTKTLGITTEILAIGRHPYPGYDYWFKGKIDDVRIYNRTLTAKEIRKLYD